jgi:RNA polymerase sigma-70 factor (ECF subfamily)
MIDDAALFEAWRGGERAAGEELIARHVEPLKRFFAAKVPQHADDLVQRTLLVCAEAKTSYRGDGTFRAFLFGVARNVLYEHFRAQARDGGGKIDFNQSSLMDLAPGVATITTKRAEHRVLFAALRELPMDLQLILELHYWEEMSVDELAAEFAIPPGTVKSRMHRARGLLADIIPRVAATPEETQSARAILQTWSADAPRVRAPAE